MTPAACRRAPRRALGPRGRLPRRAVAAAVGLLAAGVRRRRAVRGRRSASTRRARARAARGWLFGAGWLFPAHRLDVVPHRPGYLVAAALFAGLPRRRRRGRARRAVAGDRPTGGAHARRGDAVVLPGRRRAARDARDRPGVGAAARGRPPRRRRSCSRGSCSRSASRSPGRRRSCPRSPRPPRARRPSPTALLGFGAVVLVLVARRSRSRGSTTSAGR